MWSTADLHRMNNPQCKALSLMHLNANCCVLSEGHRGSHENNLGTKFKKCVYKSIDLPDGWGRKCKDHPKYQYKRPPRSACEMCWRLFVKYNS